MIRAVRVEVFTVALSCAAVTVVMGGTSTPRKPKPGAERAYNRGLALVQEGQYADALRFFQYACRQDEDYAVAYLRAGICHDRLGRTQRAIVSYQKAIGYDATLDSAYLLLGEAYERQAANMYDTTWYQGQVRQLQKRVNAMKAYKQAVGINPDLVEAQYRFGSYCLYFRGYQRALQAFQEAVRVRPSFPEAQYSLGLAFAGLGRHEEAVAAYKQALHFRPDFVEAEVNLGAEYAQAGRFEEAMSALKEALVMSPDNPHAYYNLGLTYAGQECHREALDAYVLAARFDSARADVYLNIGVEYNHFGRKDEAMQAFRRAVRIDPNDAAAHYNLGVAYLDSGDRDAARKEEKKLRKLGRQLANRLLDLIAE